MHFFSRESNAPSYKLTKYLNIEHERLIGEEYESPDHDVVAIVLSTTESCIGKGNKNVFSNHQIAL